MAQTRNEVTITEKLLATKSSSYSTNLWDCGSTLYDSFELNSFNRQLHSAIAKSPITRTLSMPHLPERSLHAFPVQPPPPSIAMPRKFFNFSRSFHKLIRSVFKSYNKTSTTSFSFQVPEKYSKERFYVVYDKSGPVLSTIPEVPEFEIGALSPEISSHVRRSASERILGLGSLRAAFFSERNMAKEILTLDNATTCTSWNHSGTRLAAASADGTLSIFDSRDPSSSSSLRSTFKSRVLEGNIVKIVWVPPEYGDAVACISADGIMSLWEEVAEDSQSLQWKMCKSFGDSSSKVLDVQFGISSTSLKMVAAYSDGNIRVFELLDPLELRNLQLQAEFQNVIESVSAFGKASCLSASISWNLQKGGSQESSFLVGFNSNTSELNSSKVWEFDQAHQRWLPVAELALPEDKGDQVYAVAWAPNIGRPYEIIAVATHKGLAIWHLGLNPDHDGRLPVERVALLSGHQGMVWQMEWDMSGMTLATTGQDGMVRLWQSNLNGVWHQQAAFEPTS